MAFIDPSELLATAFEPKVSNRFIMDIDGIPGFMVKTAATPNFTSDEVVLDHINTYRKIKGKQRWGDMSLTMYDPITPSGAQAVMEWVRLSYEVWGCEVGLFYPHLYAGTTDVVGVHRGDDAIIDFKQANKPKQREWIQDYLMQLAAYALAHDVMYGTKIKKGVVMMCTRDLLYQEFVLEGESFLRAQQAWLRLVGEYHIKNSNNN